MDQMYARVGFFSFAPPAASDAPDLGGLFSGKTRRLMFSFAPFCFSLLLFSLRPAAALQWWLGDRPGQRPAEEGGEDG